jgi:FMN phosphatase YigB (HAD superfamily)
MSSQGGVPLDYLFNLINGNIKRYKTLIKYERLEKNNNKLNNLFPERFYTEDLDINQDLIEDFIYYCLENHPEVVKLIKERNKLLLIELLPRLAKEYMKIKESEKDKTQTIDD